MPVKTTPIATPGIELLREIVKKVHGQFGNGRKIEQAVLCPELPSPRPKIRQSVKRLIPKLLCKADLLNRDKIMVQKSEQSRFDRAYDVVKYLRHGHAMRTGRMPDGVGRQ